MGMAIFRYFFDTNNQFDQDRHKMGSALLLPKEIICFPQGKLLLISPKITLNIFYLFAFTTILKLFFNF
ncbi:hypothetical protein SA19056_16530 [Staphylococcus argenteus]|nr:hypothetical protein TMSFP064_13440 [Staphylococcus argenteus]GJF39446.1 hypothetical protein SA19056_16530 [Staphylococcus argenteus]GJF45730.1 hypothetical protein SA19080_02460 [Staphylococcus argenteus]GJF61331.1 hypothetical protein SA19109_03180 [Staphylococcus argenteus]GJF83488.1 hypothetical protein SA20004_17400 [Staphylococcus argenteus]